LPSLYTENVGWQRRRDPQQGLLTLEHVVLTENQTGQGDWG
jgi:hypothetical protein